MTCQVSLKTLNTFAQELDRYFRAHERADAVLANWLRLQFHPVQVYALVQQIISNPALLAEVSARSYRHANGFLKVVLLDRGYKLRLHVWFPGSACEENIHDHRWSFASTILAGGLVSEIWADTTDPQAQQFPEFLYHAATPTQPSHKEFMGESLLTRVCTRSQPSGSAYVLEEQTLHRIINPGTSLVATLMCTAPTGQGTTRLVTTANGIDPNVQPPRIQPEELKLALQQFLTLYFGEKV